MKIIKDHKRNVTAGRTSRKKQFGIKAARVGKTKMVKVLQGNYGYGWDDLCEYEMNDPEWKSDLRAYRENEPGVSFRVIQRRVPNPDYVEPVAESTSVKKRYTVRASKKIAGSRGNDVDEDGYPASDNKRFEREQFAENLIHELEMEYSFKVPTDTWGKIMDLADDLSFGENAHQHGSTPMLELESIIYDIIEEDMGVVIGSTAVSGSQRINVSEWENSYEPDEYSTDPDGLGFEQNRAISLVGDILDDWQNRTPTMLDESIIDEVYDLACSEPKSCQELADEVYAILEENYPELIDASTDVNAAQADTTVSQADVDELVLYITNDGDLYRGRVGDIIKNLKRKVKNGTYDRDLAVKAWQYLADDGVRKYDKEFGSGKGSLSWLNPTTRKAIATELRDYYEEEIFYEDSVSSSTAIHAASEIDIDEVKSAIKQAGITVWDVKRSRIHTGYIYEVVLDNPDDSTAAIEAIRSAGFTVTFDSISGNSMFVYIEDARLENAFLYRVSFEYTSEIVRMSNETSNDQDVLDACIDQMEADGNTGYLYTMDEVEQQGWYEDEYVIGGNRGLALYHGGNFHIEPLGWSDEVGNITAAVATNHDSMRTYDADSKRDAKYLNALGKGVVRDLTQAVGDTTVFGGGFIYEISDSAITFIASGNGDVLYIQPLDHIEPNMNDLEADIEELSGSIYSEIMPKF